MMKGKELGDIIHHFIHPREYYLCIFHSSTLGAGYLRLILFVCTCPVVSLHVPVHDVPVVYMPPDPHPSSHPLKSFLAVS